MSIPSREELAGEFKHDVKKARLSRARSKALARMKSPEAKKEKEKSKRLTKDTTDSYWYAEKHQGDY